MKIAQGVIVTAMLGFMAVSCTQTDTPDNVRGMKPIYITKDQAFQISTVGPQKILEPGKIYIMGSYLFIVERSKGVHVLDNSDPANPVKLSFVNIPGVIDVAVKGHILFADNITDLVALDISNINNITLSKRVKDVYPIVNRLYPAEYSGYFECADTSKGLVVGWEEVDLIMPKCYRNSGDGLVFNEK